MSRYIDLELNHSTFIEIVDNLRECVKHKDNYWEIEDLVHLIDLLEELEREDSARQNREFQREREYREIFKDKSVEEYHQGMVVMEKMKTLIGYDPFDSEEFQFNNAMRVIDAIKREYDLVKKDINE